LATCMRMRNVSRDKSRVSIDSGASPKQFLNWRSVRSEA